MGLFEPFVCARASVAFVRLLVRWKTYGSKAETRPRVRLLPPPSPKPTHTHTHTHTHIHTERVREDAQLLTQTKTNTHAHTPVHTQRRARGMLLRVAMCREDMVVRGPKAKPSSRDRDRDAGKGKERLPTEVVS